MDESIRIREATVKGYAVCPKGGVFNINFFSSNKRRARVQGGGWICPTITSADNGMCVNEGIDIEKSKQLGMIIYKIRKFTPREVFRLMDVDDADIDKIEAAKISRSQQCKMGGNSIVVACLYHIVKKLDLKKRLANTEEQ